MIQHYKILDKYHNFSKETKILEIGIWEAESTKYIMQNYLTHADSILEAVDIRIQEVAFEAVWELPEYERTTLIETSSDNFFDVLNDETYDVIIIDGDHLYPQVLRDGLNASKVLEDNGILVFDDVQLHKIPKYKDSGVKRALQELEQQWDLESLLDSKNNTIWTNVNVYRNTK